MKLDKLKIAKIKAENLLDYINKYTMQDLQSVNGLDIDSVLIYDVIDVLNDEIKNIELKNESKSARALLS